MRSSKGYTIAQLATLAGVSKSFISMLENGHTNISANKLERIADLFGLRASDLLPAADTTSLIHVVKDGQGPAIRGFDGDVRAHLLTKDLHRRIQPVLMQLAPGSSHNNAVGHPGEEFIYILAGQVQLTLNLEQHVTLDVGDAAHYPSSLSHRYDNVGASEAVLITISTPPKII
jgi:quercetin dioxygenase-like cupin family protein/DNA-binding XRE family transcriptional regulator